MMRQRRKIRVVTLAQVTRVGAAVPLAGAGSVRHVILQTAMGGAAVMLLLTIGLLFLGRASKVAARPRPQLVPQPSPSPGPDLSAPKWLAPANPPAAEAVRTPEPPQSPEAPEPSKVVTQRHEVALGDDRIEVVLAETPGPDGATRPGSYVRWAPLPYDIPDDGLAFACVGAGDEGCLFVDLAAAPGPVAITGDQDATIRLAESILHQLCTGAAADQAISVLVVGGSVPGPHPANVTSVPTLRDLAEASRSGPPGRTDIVFCESRSDEDAFALASDVASSAHPIVPVVLGHMPGAAWSFTATASGR